MTHLNNSSCDHEIQKDDNLKKKNTSQKKKKKPKLYLIFKRSFLPLSTKNANPYVPNNSYVVNKQITHVLLPLLDNYQSTIVIFLLNLYSVHLRSQTVIVLVHFNLFDATLQFLKSTITGMTDTGVGGAC